MRTKKICVVGSLAYDYIMDYQGEFADHILPDAVHNLSVSFLVQQVNRHYGGTAGNVAYSLAQFGVKVQVRSCLGADGKDYANRLKRWGVDMSTIRIDKKKQTASAYIMTDVRDNQITAFAPGALGVPVKQRIGSDIAFGIIIAASPDDVRTMPREFKKAGVPYLFDPAQCIPALSGAVLRAGIFGSYITIGNDYELAMMLKKTGWTKEQLLDKTKYLITTFSEKGSRVSQKGKRIIVIPSYKVKKAMDPTGAGDAYRAGLLYGLSQGMDIAQSAAYGSTVASLPVEHVGTQKHTVVKKEVEKRVKTILHNKHLSV